MFYKLTYFSWPWMLITQTWSMKKRKKRRSLRIIFECAFPSLFVMFPSGTLKQERKPVWSVVAFPRKWPFSQEAKELLEGRQKSLRLIAINSAIDLFCHYVFSKHGWDSPKEIDVARSQEISKPRCNNILFQVSFYSEHGEGT